MGRGSLADFRNVIFVRLHDDTLTHEGGNVKSVLVADNGDVLSLEAGDGAAADFVKETYFVSYFHSEPV